MTIYQTSEDMYKVKLCLPRRLFGNILTYIQCFEQQLLYFALYSGIQ